ncbi:MAG TPA: hypothetical protein VF470_06170 [Sphingomicrobium sp.]
MQQEERDRTLLAILEPEDRHKIDDVVDDDLATVDGANLEAAAAAFDLRADGLPDDEKVVAWQIAAALRLRASQTLGVH